MSMIEIAYALLEEKTDRQAMSFQEIIAEIKAAAEMSDQELKTRLAQFYTDINIDGRFLTVGDNHWGLRGWYPFDQAEEEVIPVAKPKKAVVEEVEDFDDLEEDLDYEDVDDLDEEEDFEDIDELEEDEDDLAEDDFDDLEDDLDDDEEDEEEDYEDEKEK